MEFSRTLATGEMNDEGSREKDRFSSSRFPPTSVA